jgi:hypothetical protein
MQQTIISFVDEWMKLANVSIVPGSDVARMARMSPVVNGTEARFVPKFPGAKVRKTEGPRAYGPRIDSPTV